MVPDKCFYVPFFSSCQDYGPLIRKLLFLGRLLTGDNMAPVLHNQVEVRSQRYFDTNIVSLGVLLSICEALHKYELFSYFDSWFSDFVLPTYSTWKSIVKTEIRDSEENTWENSVLAYPSYKLANACVSPQMFWSISNQYPDLFTRPDVQIRLMGNFGFSSCVPSRIRDDTSFCFACKKAKDDLYHFLFDCSYFHKNFDSLWR